MDSFTTTYTTGPVDAPVDEWRLKTQTVMCVIANVATVSVQAPVDEWRLKTQTVMCVIA
jgi:hypothetical protein